MKAEFISDLDVRVIVQGYRLLSPLHYISLVGGKQYITVPDGFVTDFASIPRIARFLITGHGHDRWAAVVHDYLYSVRYDRKMADAIFYEALLISEVNKIKARAMYRAVRTGGWMFF